MTETINMDLIDEAFHPQSVRHVLMLDICCLSLCWTSVWNVPDQLICKHNTSSSSSSSSLNLTFIQCDLVRKHWTHVSFVCVSVCVCVLQLQWCCCYVSLQSVLRLASRGQQEASGCDGGADGERWRTEGTSSHVSFSWRREDRKQRDQWWHHSCLCLFRSNNYCIWTFWCSVCRSSFNYLVQLFFKSEYLKTPKRWLVH